MWTGQHVINSERNGDALLPRNALLSALPPHDLQRLHPFLEKVPLTARRVLQHAALPIEHVYFIEEGLVSVLASADEKTCVEVRLVGREGAIGTEAVLGATISPLRHYVQIGGSAFRISVGDLDRAMAESPRLRAVLYGALHEALQQSSQAAACSLSHSLLQRLSRWLLSAQDRAASDALPITQELLARNLGVRRASISEAFKPLERSGIFARERGLIRILDRGPLERMVCRCYRLMRPKPGNTDRNGRWPLLVLSMLALLEIELLAQ